MSIKRTQGLKRTSRAHEPLRDLLGTPGPSVCPGRVLEIISIVVIDAHKGLAQTSEACELLRFGGDCGLCCARALGVQGGGLHMFLCSVVQLCNSVLHYHLYNALLLQLIYRSV